MEFSTSWYIFPVVFMLDLVLGDPKMLPHPIRWMGRAITASEPLFRNLPLRPTISGAFFSISLIGATWILTLMLVNLTRLIHPLVTTGVEILLIYYCISIRSLDSSAMEIHRALIEKRLQDAKAKVALIVGRDVGNLKEEGIARATVETVGENLVDGVISPLFFAAIGGAPLAMAFKMVNTLDSMVGYKNEIYLHFGKVAARIDDFANYVPARLSIPIISASAQILSNKGSLAYRTAIEEGANHNSPNAGYPEAAFAGALGVKLGGPSYYQGHLVSKPYIGVRFDALKTGDIKKACDLMILSSLIWLVILWGITVIISFFK